MNTTNDNSDKKKDTRSESDKPKETIHLSSAEELQDNDHKMNKRVNEVQDSVTYNQNIRQDTTNTSDPIERRWNDIKSDYRMHYDSLTDDDMSYDSGDFNSVVERIAQRTHRNPSDVQQEIKNWKLSDQ